MADPLLQKSMAPFPGAAGSSSTTMTGTPTIIRSGGVTIGQTTYAGTAGVPGTCQTAQQYEASVRKSSGATPRQNITVTPTTTATTTMTMPNQQASAKMVSSNIAGLPSSSFTSIQQPKTISSVAGEFYGGAKESLSSGFGFLPLAESVYSFPLHPKESLTAIGGTLAAGVSLFGVQELTTEQLGKNISPKQIGYETTSILPFAVLGGLAMRQPKPVVEMASVSVIEKGMVSTPISKDGGITISQDVFGYETIGQAKIAMKSSPFSQKTMQDISFGGRYTASSTYSRGIGTVDIITPKGLGKQGYFLSAAETKAVGDINYNYGVLKALPKNQIQGFFGGSKEIVPNQYLYVGMAGGGKTIFPVGAKINIISPEMGEGTIISGGKAFSASISPETVQISVTNAANIGGQSLSSAVSASVTNAPKYLSIATPTTVQSLKTSQITGQAISQKTMHAMTPITSSASKTTYATQLFNINMQGLSSKTFQAQTPGSITTPITAPITSSIQTPTITPITPIIPTTFFPIALAFPTLSFNMARGMKTSTKKQKKAYTPSLTALIFNIKAFKMPKMAVTGLGIRPIITGRKMRKR